jgi:membrane protein implicated in regulation of membrane protease activity
MDDWVIWTIAAVALAVGEIVTVGFFLGPLAIAAGLAAVVALAGGGLTVQLLAFVVGSVGSLGLIRPVAKRHLQTPARIRTGTAALIGARAVVLERVDVHSGSVKIGGEVWTARTYDEDDVIEPGARVEVMEIQGATALVAK